MSVVVATILGAERDKLARKRMKLGPKLPLSLVDHFIPSFPPLFAKAYRHPAVACPSLRNPVKSFFALRSLFARDPRCSSIAIRFVAKSFFGNFRLIARCVTLKSDWPNRSDSWVVLTRENRSNLSKNGYLNN